MKSDIGSNGCICYKVELPTKNYPYTPKQFVAYQPDCPSKGHGLFKRAGVDKKKKLPTSFVPQSAAAIDLGFDILLEG